MQRWRQSSRPTGVFKVALTFAVLVVTFQFIVVKFIDWIPLQLITVNVTSALLQVSGVHVVSDGIQMTVANARWMVISDCVAPGAYAVFLSFILAYPSAIKAKAVAVGVGFPVLFASNIIRLVVLGWLTALSPTVAAYCHDFVWQVGFIFIVVAMWLFWIEWMGRHEKYPAVSA